MVQSNQRSHGTTSHEENIPMGASKPAPNGTEEPVSTEVSSLPLVIGIDFGNTYSSIAVFTKEGFAESIADEDGERQIACAIAFHGEEIYIGNHAKPKLIKNASNTILGFRDLLGKRFSEINLEDQGKLNSAPVFQHPEFPDEPAYRVDVLHPAPTPLSSTTTNVSAAQTPAASFAPTPRSEPIPATRSVTVSEATTLFLQYIVQTASDFLGKAILGAVISIPSFFTERQKSALLKAAEDAGIHVLQILDEIGAAAAFTTSELWASTTGLQPDRTQLIVDLGMSSLSLALLSLREGLAHIIVSSCHTDVNGRQIDDKLIRYFAKDFTKKNKVTLQVCPSTQVADKRAEAKLRLAVEHTKRTLSASPGAATCSVESLCEGLDYTGSINRMRFDLEMRPIYAAVALKVRELLDVAALDTQYVDEIVYVGGKTSLPGLNEHLCLDCGFSESITTPFSTGTIGGGDIGDPTEILARGCALQAELLYSIRGDDTLVQKAIGDGGKWGNVEVTGRTVGLFPGSNTADGDIVESEATWICILPKETPLPARRTAVFDVSLSDPSKSFALEIWEINENMKVEKITLPKEEPAGEKSDGDVTETEGEEEEEEEEEIKTKMITKEACLGSLKLQSKAAVKIKGRWKTTVEVRLMSNRNGEFDIVVQEQGKEGAIGELRIGAQVN